MNGFYVSLVFFGVLLVLFSLACIFIDKNKVFSFMKGYDDKKQELVEIISDAEQMIEELNRFSDYIVNQMDIKNEELSKNLKLAEEKINVLSMRAGIICNEAEAAVTQVSSISMKQSVETTNMEIHAVDLPTSIAVNGGAIDTSGSSYVPYFKFNSDFIATSAKKSEKVIPINNKFSEVIKLSQEGMQGLEIAQKLKMGKGEVELILGLRK